MQAAKKLVEEVVASQQAANPNADIDISQEMITPQTRGPILTKALSRCSPLMMYTIKRLAKGLASGREGARQGYAMALASLLQVSHLPCPLTFSC